MTWTCGERLVMTLSRALIGPQRIRERVPDDRLSESEAEIVINPLADRVLRRIPVGMGEECP